MIDADAFALMKPTAYLINVARGEVIVEKALYTALKERRIDGAALDTWYRYPGTVENAEPDPDRGGPFQGSQYDFNALDNVLLTPHSSAHTFDADEGRYVSIAKSLREYAQGQTPKRLVATGTGENLGDFNCHEPDLQAGITAATCHAPTHARVLRWQGDVVVWRKVFFEEKNMSELETFRAETRAWLEENCPASMRTPMPEREMPWGGRNASYPNPDTKVWMDNMASRGWTAPSWPAEYGGGGLSKEGKQNSAGRACPHQSRAGTDELAFGCLAPRCWNLPAKSRRKNISVKSSAAKSGCQGYSEPGAGSRSGRSANQGRRQGRPLSGKRSGASPYADQCDWIFCLVRTDKSVKHDGMIQVSKHVPSS